MRDTTFRFALAPTAEQASTLARHCGASRFALNQCLQLVTDALAANTVEATDAIQAGAISSDRRAGG
jgi:putative transposase